MLLGGFPIQIPDPSGYTEWGYLGALIFLVVAFGGFLLKMDASNKAYQDKRDNEWRTFFTAINADGKEDIKALAETMRRMVESLDKHDQTVNDRVVKTLDRIDHNTTPRSTRAKQ